MPTLYKIPGQRERHKTKSWPIRLLGALSVLLFLGTMISTTQYMAWNIGHNRWSGHFYTLRGVRLYPPWAFVDWFITIRKSFDTTRYRGVRPAASMLLAGMGFSALCCLTALYLKSSRYSTLHGSARFADLDDIKSAGLLVKTGVYVGGWMNGKEQIYLRHNGKEHIIAFAPTRSGKGVGLVIPTLVGWDQSAVVLDIKGENWALTSGWRKQNGQYVMRWDPTDTVEGRSVRYNPLEAIRIRTKDEVADVQNVATLLVDPNGEGIKTFWDIEACNLLTGAILHVLYMARSEGRVGTLGEVLQALTTTGCTDAASIVTPWLSFKHLSENDEYKFINAQGEEIPDRTHPVVKTVAAGIIAAPAETAGSILKTATSKLDLYKDPTVVKNTAHSDFKIEDLMDANKPVSLYIVLNPKELGRLRPLIRIFLSQLLFTLMPEMKFKDGSMKPPFKHKLLLLLDEFPSLGNLGIFEQALAYMGGWNIKCYLICQDTDQLSKAYGKEETITSNCHVTIAYAPNKVPTAEYLSKRTGVMTVVGTNESVSYSGSGLFSKKSVSKSIQETQRPVMTVDEVMTLPGALKDGENIVSPGDMLIFAAGFPPVYGKQILFFRDSYMSDATKIPAPSQSDKLKTEPDGKEEKNKTQAKPEKETSSEEKS